MAVKNLVVWGVLLFAVSAARAQLVFEPASHDFGPVREEGGRVSCTFTGVNCGDRPVVLLDVVASCGCTVPEYSRKPVLAGDSTRIVVSFDPENRPGAFSKELGVYSSERKKIATLKIEGTVTPRPRSVEELYPVDAGGGVRLSTSLCSFAYLHAGREVHAAVEYVNTSRRPVAFRLRPVETSGCLRITAPERIGAGERGTIDVAYAVPVENPRYGTVKDTFEVEVGGRSNGTVLMAHGIAVDDPAAMRGRPAPAMRLSENTLRFGEVAHGAAVEQRSFVLLNEGDGELIVRAVEHRGHLTTSLRAGIRIAPHGTLPVEVTIRPSAEAFGPLLDRLTIVTNDPAHPMRQLRVTAVIADIY